MVHEGCLGRRTLKPVAYIDICSVVIAASESDNDRRDLKLVSARIVAIWLHGLC